MFYAVLSNGKEINWHVGKEKPTYELAKDVVEVQADGHELEHIENQFSNIPIPKTGVRVVRWFGDMAKFIVANL